MCSFPALLSLCEYQASRKCLSLKLRALPTIVAWSKSKRKAGRRFRKLRMQSSHQRIKQLDEQCSDLVRKLSSIISQEHFDTLSKVISHNANNKLKEKVKNRHSRKLTDMGTFVREDPYVDKNRWVINLSNRQLSEHETSALQNGLNFVTIPNTVPTSHIVANIESGIYNLSGSAKATIPASEHLEEQQT